MWLKQTVLFLLVLHRFGGELWNSLSKASDVQGLDDSLEEIQIDQLDEVAGGSSQSDCSVLHGGEPDLAFRYLHSKPSTLTDQSDPIIQIQSAPSLSITSCGQSDPEIHVHPTQLLNPPLLLSKLFEGWQVSQSDKWT